MANRILVLWPSGNVLCEGESALATVPATSPTSTEDHSPSTEPCPPTKRSRGNDGQNEDGESGIFRRGERNDGDERAA